jgi:hypothetical protein
MAIDKRENIMLVYRCGTPHIHVLLINWVGFIKMNGWFYTGSNSGTPHDLIYDDVNDLYIMGGNNINTATSVNSIIITVFNALNLAIVFH